MSFLSTTHKELSLLIPVVSVVSVVVVVRNLDGLTP